MEPKSNESRTEFSCFKYQYLAVGCANIMALCQGFAVGWLSPSLLILQSENAPLLSGPITLHQTVLLGGLFQSGALIGNILYTFLSNYYGRIVSIIFVALPNMLSSTIIPPVKIQCQIITFVAQIFWIILICSNSFELIATGRMLAGVSAGGIFVFVPLFVAEISDKKIRGFLGSLFQLTLSIGILSAYICGAFLEFKTVPYVIISFPLIFCVAMMCLPETPQSLLKQKQLKKAEESFIFYNNGNSYNNIKCNLTEELHNLQLIVEQREENKKQSTFKIIFNKTSMKGISIGLCLTIISVFTGNFAMNTYAANIFKDSGANFDPNTSAIILASLQSLGVLFSSVVVDRWGRRKLFGTSSLLAGVSLTMFGIFSFLDHRGFDLSAVYWMPVTCASFSSFINYIGLKPLPFIYVAEILPDNVRRIGSSICMFALSLGAAITIFLLPIIVDLYGVYTVMWIFSGFCFLGVIFSIFIMTETKGKNLNKIESK